MRFSERTAWELGENAFAAKLRAARESGREPLDLTVSNPTACGLKYDERALLAPLAERAALIYEPEALGMVSAREAVRGYYRDHGAEVPVERVCLTVSTSEAYSYLFRLLCDEGDEVLVASPSYPLFEYIARLDGVRLREYPLVYDPHAGWQIDLGALESAVSARTRAVIVVHPNNPTGHFCSERERGELERICAERGLALVVDEVFLDYGVAGVEARSFTVGPDIVRTHVRESGHGAPGLEQPLTFVLSGLSKVCGLPQMKCSWIVASGPGADEAMGRLEIVADTFLSMNAPVQHALPAWLAGRGGIQGQIRSRCEANLRVMDAVLAGSDCERLAMDAGWTAVVRVPRVGSFAERALEVGVVVQPGEFYGLAEGRVVVSLLTVPEVWVEGLGRLVALG